MNILALIVTLNGALALGGHVAYLDGGAVTVLDLASGAAVQAGPGPADGPPCWSPDGAWLAFETGVESGERAVYVVRPDGSESRRVAGSAAWNTAPAWSTDGGRIVFCSAPAPGAPGQIQVYDLNADTLAVWGGGEEGLARPQWLPFTGLLRYLNPDQDLEVPGVDMARMLAEARMEDEQLHARTPPEAALAVRVYRGGADGALATTIVLLTKSEVLPVLALADPDGGNAGAARWGATANWNDARIASVPGSDRRYGAYTLEKPGDTDRIAWESNEGGDRELYVLGKRGIANVSNHRSADWNPAWSPDGKLLAFESFRDGYRGIYTVYTDTAHVRPVAAGPEAARWSPAWSPDGEHVVYVSDESGAAQIHASRVDGGGTVALTGGGGPKEAPAWRPIVE